MAFQKLGDVPGFNELESVQDNETMLKLKLTTDIDMDGLPLQLRNMMDETFQNIAYNLDERVCIHNGVKFTIIMPGNNYFRRQLKYLLKSNRSNEALVIIPKNEGYVMYQYGQVIQEDWHRGKIQSFMNYYILKKNLKQED